MMELKLHKKSDVHSKRSFYFFLSLGPVEQQTQEGVRGGGRGGMGEGGRERTPLGAAAEHQRLTARETLDAC